MIQTLSDRWTRFWFEPESPTNLAICRILFYGSVFLFYLPRHYDGWAELPDFVHRPVTILGKLGFEAMGPEIMAGVEWSWKVALFLCCIGFATRSAAFVAAALSLYLFSLPNDFGKINHNDQPLVLAMWILAFSRSADAISVGAWWRRRFKGRSADSQKWSGEYRWPVRAVWLVMALTLFAAGVAKLRFGGIEWMASQTMTYHFISHNYPFLSFPPWTNWGLAIAQYPLLCSILAIISVFTELLFPLALFHPLARAILVPAAFSMQLGIRALLGPHFEQYAMVYLFFIPWGHLLQRAGKLRA